MKILIYIVCVMFIISLQEKIDYLSSESDKKDKK